MREVHTQHIYRAEDGKLYKREYLTRSNTLRDDKEVSSFSVFRIIAIVLLVACVFSLFSQVNVPIEDREYKSFAGFLTMMTNIPNLIDTSNLLNIVTFELGNWGIFEPLAVMIESLGTALSFVIWLGAVCVNFMQMGFYFILWIVS